MSSALDAAIATARGALPIQREVAKPEYWTGLTIVRKPRDGHLAVYFDRAWVEPTERGFLPWPGPPIGEPVARVALDGTVTMIDGTA